MALPPTRTGPTTDARADMIRRIRQPVARPTGEAPRRAPEIDLEPVALPVAPQPGFRLRTATTDEEIEAQIARLRTLIANDNIDPEAPPGSYLNILL